MYKTQCRNITTYNTIKLIQSNEPTTYNVTINSNMYEIVTATYLHIKHTHNKVMSNKWFMV